MSTQHHHCSICQRSDIKLYRYYGRLLRDNEIFCKQHIPPNTITTVPLVEDEDGSVWGATSVPAEAWKRWNEVDDGA